MMRAMKGFFAAFTLAVATACVQSDSPPKLDSEGHSFADPVKQERLKRELTAAGVPFTLEIKGGQEFINWSVRDAERANAVRIALFGPDLPLDRHISYDDKTQAEFKSWLTENGIAFSTAVVDGDEYVIWDEAVDSRVRQWHLPLPPEPKN
jgi:hypothetical protein